jgi:hypothetical protein
MGQEQSKPFGPGMNFFFFVRKKKYGFFKIETGNQLAILPSDWRYTIRTIAIERRTVTINKEQYRFGKELGSGAFGAVYSARRVLDSQSSIFLFN